MPGRVIVVGSVNVDLVVMTDRLPGRGETVIGGRFARHHGGKGANQAVAAARLGAPTVFVGAIGRDAFGEDARTALIHEGVDVGELLVVDEEPTGVALIVVDRHGENSIAVASGANASLTVGDIETAFGRLAPTTGDIVLVGLEIPPAVAGAALQHGRAAGATTILNPAPASGIDRQLLALADVVTPNQGEASVLEAVMGPLHDIAPAVIVSGGASGARLTVAGRAVVVPAPSVHAVDTVGAGDTLNGALAAGLAAGLELEMAARRAVGAASLAVTRAGAREGMPTLAELEAFLAG